MLVRCLFFVILSLLGIFVERLHAHAVDYEDFRRDLPRHGHREIDDGSELELPFRRIFGENNQGDEPDDETLGEKAFNVYKDQRHDLNEFQFDSLISAENIHQLEEDHREIVYRVTDGENGFAFCSSNVYFNDFSLTDCGEPLTRAHYHNKK